MDLELKLKKAHEMYEARLADSPHLKEKIERDYERLVHVIEAVKSGEGGAGVARDLGVQKRTVYFWLNSGFPYYLTNRRCNARRIDTEQLVKSGDFAYVLGVYQAKAKRVNRYEIAVKLREEGTAKKLTDVIESVFGRANKWREDGMHCIGYSSSRLMEFIKKSTENNSKVPDYIKENRRLAVEYLRGFFDSRGNVSYHTRRIKNSGFPRRSVEVNIIKANYALLSEVKGLLNSLGIECSLYEDSLVVRKRRAVRQFLKLRLVSGERYKKLKRMYTDLCDLMRFDKGGELGKVIKQVDMEKERIKQERLKGLKKARLEREIKEKRALEDELLQYLNKSADV
jgi:uncharacterized protein YdcH (DUF465 family)